MNVPVTIRRATQNDVPTIVAFSAALFREDAGQRDPSMNLDWAAQEGNAYFSHMLTESASIIFLAEVASRAVGYLAGYVRGSDSLHPQPSAELESMFVQDGLRAQGVGKALAQEFFEWCKSHGAQRISVTAYYKNENAVRFYQRLGFNPKQLTLEATPEYLLNGLHGRTSAF